MTFMEQHEWSGDERELVQRTAAFARELERAGVDGAPRTTREGFRRLGEFGLLGLSMPEVYGGSGAGVVATVLALEALGHACGDRGLAFSVAAQLWSVQMPLLHAGTEAQRRLYLPALVSGASVGALAMSEPGAGSDVFAMTTRAEAREDGFVLSGRKTYCTNAPIADLFLILASTGEGRVLGTCSLFLVERDTSGLAIESPMSKMGLETSPMADVVLDDCAVPRSALLGRWARGAQIFHETMIWERGGLLAPFVGAMQRQLETCTAYARDRRQFGQPIGKFQAVSHRLAEMRLRLETARLLLHDFARRKARGEEAALESALVKLHVSEAYVQSSLDAIQIHGGSGYATEVGVERDLRDAIGLRICSGTNDIQRNAIARALGL